MIGLPLDDQWVISIGDVHIRLRIEPSDAAERFFMLFKAYHDFIKDVSPGTVEFFLDATLTKSAHKSINGLPIYQAEGDSLGFEMPGVTGSCNFKSGSGDIIIQSKYPEQALELILRQITAILAVRSGGLLVHGAGLIHRDKGFLFIGHSGAGKTTIAKLSKKDVILNDDLIFLSIKKNTWFMHSTPFSHPDQARPTNTTHRLDKILRIIQDKLVYLSPMTPAQALGEVLSNIPVTPLLPEYTNQTLSLGFELNQSVPIQYLHFRPDLSFWDVIEGNLTTDR